MTFKEKIMRGLESSWLYTKPWCAGRIKNFPDTVFLHMGKTHAQEWGWLRSTGTVFQCRLPNPLVEHPGLSILEEGKVRPQFPTVVTSIDCHFLLLCASMHRQCNLSWYLQCLRITRNYPKHIKPISSVSKGHRDIPKHWTGTCTFLISLVPVKM